MSLIPLPSKLVIIGAAVLIGVTLEAWVLNKAYNAGWNTKAAQDAAASATHAAENLAQRSKLDAKIPDMDAAAACRSFGYKWVLIDGKGQCGL